MAFPVWAVYASSDFKGHRLDPALPDPEGKEPMVGRTNLLSMSYPCSLTPNDPLAPGYVCFYAPSPVNGGGNISFSDVEVAIEDDGKTLESFIADYRRLVAMDLAASVADTPGVKPMLPMGSGVLLRWSKKSDTVLGLNGKKDIVWVGMENFALLPSDDMPYPSRNYFMTTIMQQRLVCKYKALLHWGKNRDNLFLNPKCPYRRNLGSQMGEFAKLQRAYDPKRIFEPPLYKQIRAKPPSAAPPRL